MSSTHHSYATRLRVRYSETDHAGNFYPACALDWFEFGRTEALRALGLPYVNIEKDGVMLPVIEMHICCHSRAWYDDLIEIRSTISLSGKARLRFDSEVVQAENGAPVASGYTVHAIITPEGRPIRPPKQLLVAMSNTITPSVYTCFPTKSLLGSR